MGSVRAFNCCSPNSSTIALITHVACEGRNPAFTRRSCNESALYPPAAQPVANSPMSTIATARARAITQNVRPRRIVTTIEPPEEHHLPEGAHTARSIVLVNTGDGKGKSTAAFGVVMRGVARGWKVAVVQFLKSGEWHVGEEDIARRLGVEWWALGEGFTWDSENLTQDQAVAREAWARAKSLIKGDEYQLVVLDEITYPMTWGWIDTDDVVSTIRARPTKVNVVATGRDAPAALLDVADTATEMRKIKHAYDAGILAKKGIDY
jgi:cob(I)alamin adenosyltransferase